MAIAALAYSGKDVYQVLVDPRSKRLPGKQRRLCPTFGSKPTSKLHLATPGLRIDILDEPGMSVDRLKRVQKKHRCSGP